MPQTATPAPVRPSPPLSPPRAPAARGRASGIKPQRSSRGRGLLLTLVVILGAVAVWGAPYYALPLEERVRSPMHPWLRPSGYVGQSAGIASLLVMLFLWVYPLRKRWRWLGFTGSLAAWLDVHVVVALVLPLLVAIHSAWRFDGLIGLGVLSMMIVWASGVVGRYLYVRIPRGKAGIELSREEIATQRKELIGEIAARVRLDAEATAATLSQASASPRAVGLVAAVRQMFRDRRARRDALRHLERLLTKETSPRPTRSEVREVLSLAEAEMRLAQQASLLDATQQLFRLWHVLHRPVALAALLAVTIHVAVVVALGATWFR
ncbi:MAG TPA: hypothetical protein VMC86_12305 [Gemmatimonadales bacterium]|nr:hypothetical protein [Gemmatimonadales bacterium]